MMLLSRSDKTGRAVLFLVLLACALGGCGGPGPGRSDRFPTASTGDLDFGQDWATPSARPGQAPAEGRTSIWTIVLGTFTSDDHVAAAADMLRRVRSLLPEPATARAHTTGRGSMVIYGAYSGPDDPDAQADLQRIKQTTIGGRPAFRWAMLSRIRLQSDPGRLHPLQLLSVRKRFPDVDPLYTLQVAVWGDFESGQLSLAEIRKRAEADTRKLRAQGFEAYFHHDDDRRLSMITVGLFDQTAIDPQSGLLSPPVEHLMRRFPQHLVNGEPLSEPIDRLRPRRGTRVQRPMLVLVPRL